VSLAPLSSSGVEYDGLVLDEGLKDGIGEAALEYAESFASAVATASSALTPTPAQAGQAARLLSSNHALGSAAEMASA